MHEKYGKIVRIHPNELSFIECGAWEDIFGFGRRPELQKVEAGTIRWPNGVQPLPIIVKTEDHTRQRRILDYAFTGKALKEQESLLQKHSDTLISCLVNRIKQPGGSSDIDIGSCFSFATFDIIGDLCFGENFQSLENADSQTWLASASKAIRFGRQLAAFDYFQPLGAMIRWCVRHHIIQGSLQKNFDWVVEKIDRRIGRNSDRPDFLKYILEHNNKQGMTRDEIDSTVLVLLLTGSGVSTVPAMTALLYFALKRPVVMDRLQKEIREAFGNNPEGITVAAVGELEYLDATLREAMRLHPPVPASNPRVVDRPGVKICGIAIPQGTRVGIPQKTAYRLACNFVEPESFLPERWLPDPEGRFALDQKAILEPFMVGPRRCIAKNLALAEMKLILVKVLWRFDLELSEKSQKDWCDQRSFLVNEKKPLYLKLELRH